MIVLVRRRYIAGLFREQMTLLMKFSGFGVSLVPPAFGKKNLSRISRPSMEIPLLFIVHPRPPRRLSPRRRKVQSSIPARLMSNRTFKISAVASSFTSRSHIWVRVCFQVRRITWLGIHYIRLPSININCLEWCGVFFCFFLLLFFSGQTAINASWPAPT